MLYRRLIHPMALMSAPLILVLLFAVACGAAATATPAQRSTSAAPAAAATSTPTAVPQAADAQAVARALPQGKRGGVIPIQNAGTVAHWSMWECGSGGTCMSIASPFYNGLIQLNGETPDPHDIRGDLAQRWELSPDGLTYTFHLVENAQWWDGVPVTADDVVWSLEEMTREGAPRPRSGQIRTYYDSSRAIDPYTVEVKLQRPAAAFIPFMATEFMKILPRHHVEPGLAQDESFMKKWENILGSGPFKPKKYDKDVSIEYERNPDYFKEGLPYFDGMIYFPMTETGTIIAAYKAGQVMMPSFVNSNLTPRDGLELEKDLVGKFTVYYPGPLGWAGLLINTKVEPFTDPRVRRALNLALHRQPFVEIFTAGKSPIGTPFPPDDPLYLPTAEVNQLPGMRQTADGEKHPDDIAAAKALLAEAGYPNGFKTSIMAAQFIGFPDMAQVAADQLQRFLNIDATVEPIETAAGYVRYEAGDWRLGFHANGFLILDPDAIIAGSYLKEGTRNYSGWEPPLIRELFEQQSREADPLKRKALIMEMADYIMNVDTHVAITHWTLVVTPVDNRIKNYHVPNVFPAHTMKEHLWLDDS